MTGAIPRSSRTRTMVTGLSPAAAVSGQLTSRCATAQGIRLRGRSGRVAHARLPRQPARAAPPSRAIPAGLKRELPFREGWLRARAWPAPTCCRRQPRDRSSRLRCRRNGTHDLGRSDEPASRELMDCSHSKATCVRVRGGTAVCLACLRDQPFASCCSRLPGIGQPGQAQVAAVVGPGGFVDGYPARLDFLLGARRSRGGDHGRGWRLQPQLAGGRHLDY